MSTEIKEPKTYADLQPGDLLYIERGHGHAKRTTLGFVDRQRADGEVLVRTDERGLLGLRRGFDYSLDGIANPALLRPTITKVTVIVLAEGGIYEEYEVTP